MHKISNNQNIDCGTLNFSSISKSDILKSKKTTGTEGKKVYHFKGLVDLILVLILSLICKFRVLNNTSEV